MNPSVDFEIFLNVHSPNLTINLSKLHARTQVHSKRALRTLRKCIVQTANAMSFLHERNIAHRDLKPQNLLVKRYRTDNVQIKLADFGISRRGKDTGMTLFAGNVVFESARI